MKNKFQQILESDPLFPRILAASTWDAQGLRKRQYLSKALSNSSDGSFIPKFEAGQVKLAYHDPDKERMRAYYDKNVIGIYWGNPKNALFHLGLVGKGYLTIVANGSASVSDLVSAGKRIQKKL